MAGLGVRLFTDEMIDPDVADALNQQGYDVLSCHAAGRTNLHISDEDQLAFAANLGRAILIYNYTDFYQLHASWQRAGRTHAGILLAPATDDLGTLLRRVIKHLDTCQPTQQADNILWVPQP